MRPPAPLSTAVSLLALCAGCLIVGDDDAATDGVDATGGTTSAESTGGPASTGGPVLDVGNADSSGGSACPAGDGCTPPVDLLVIVDNSGSMGEEQLNLALNMPKLVGALENATNTLGDPVELDVHVMVTTTDSGNVLCDPFYDPGRSPENGAPIGDACTDRLPRFESNTMPTIDASDACTIPCPVAVAPDDDYLAFGGGTDNVPDVDPADIDGDGTLDGPAARALACMTPTGIDGCGYESPLEAMREALDPAAAWNGADGFLREDSLLAVAVVTDEADCSVLDETVMMNPDFQELHPDTGMPVPTSAICWNAGVTCDGPDGDGVYANCVSTGTALRPVQEYIDTLAARAQPVVMLGVVGVPPVTAHNPAPPFEPTAGGVLDLVYRDWQDPDFDNGGDILPDEWNMGIDAAFKQFQFGIGPGCTGQTASGSFTGQAIPPVRVKEVCEALNVADDPATPEDETEVRCCLESVCGDDFAAALQCLSGLIAQGVTPPA